MSTEKSEVTDPFKAAKEAEARILRLQAEVNHVKQRIQLSGALLYVQNLKIIKLENSFVCKRSVYNIFFKIIIIIKLYVNFKFTPNYH